MSNDWLFEIYGSLRVVFCVYAGNVINVSALVVYHGYKCSLIIRYSIRYGCIGRLHRLEFKPNKRINMLCFLLTEFLLCFVHQRSKRSHTIDINSEIVNYLVRYQLIDKDENGI